MKRLLPGCAVLLTTLLCALPWGMTNAAGPVASLSATLPITVVFACGIWWPDRLPSWIAFLCGLLTDAVTGGPLGYWALLYLLALTAARTANALAEMPGLLIAWLAFAATALALSLVAWLVASMYTLEFANWSPIAWPMGILVVGFPVVAAVLMALSRWAEGKRPLRDAASGQ